MPIRRETALNKPMLAIALLLICCATSTPAQEQKKEQIVKERVPANPRLREHSLFFKPPQVYDSHSDQFIKKNLPDGLNYKFYSAVGYDLANSIMLVGPNKEGIVIVDTLGDAETGSKIATEQFAPILKKLGYQLRGGRLPIRAIIYTHNHIDHTGGVQGFLSVADRPPCPPETSQGQDGNYTARPSCVEVIGQEKIVSSVINTGTVVGNIINPRSAYMYGNLIPGGTINNGIGPFINKGNPGPGFQMPSRTFTSELKLTAAGLNMKLLYAPSETDDELAVFLPDKKNSRAAGGGAWDGPGLLLSAEIIQGPSFPNLYSLRGTSYRNPATWFRSVDLIRKLDSWCMVPSHGVPLCGKEAIQLLLRNFRDAIQFTHDQAVRHMNKGHTPPEMAEGANKITLPDYLVDELEALKPAMPRADMNPKDYLTPFYGSVPQSVRELFFGYLGWFEADPVGLSPTPQKAFAERLLQMMGGGQGDARQRVLRAGNDALKKGENYIQKSEEAIKRGNLELAKAEADKAMPELQWAAELATILVRVNHDDREARRLKAQAFLNLAIPQTNPNWRDWYITSAEELHLPDGLHFPAITGALVSPEIVAALPPGAWVNSWTMQLDSNKSMKTDRRISMAFLFPKIKGYKDSVDERYVLEIRRAICEFMMIEPTEQVTAARQGNFSTPPNPVEAKHPLKTWESADVAISITRDQLLAILKDEAKIISDRYKQRSPLAENGQPFLGLLLAAIDKGEVKLIRGDKEKIKEFFSYFDPRMIYMPNLTIR